MMLSLEKSRLYLLVLIFIAFNAQCGRAAWPSCPTANVHLLGLFDGEPDSSLASTQCQAMFKAAISLADELNITIDGQPIGWQVAQTSGDALRSTCLAISSSNVASIVGPGSSHEARAIASFARTAGIPLVSYAVTNADLSNRRTYPTFYRTVPSDTSAAEAIAKLFQRHNWTSCILIYQNDPMGDAFEKRGVLITGTIAFDAATQNLRGNLTRLLMKSTSRVIVLWTEAKYTSMILEEAANNDLLGPSFVWILSGSISLDNFDENLSHALIGMLSVEPAPSSNINESLLTAAYEMWKRYEPQSFPGENNVDPYALFTFDATWLLIQSLQRLCPDDTHDQSRPCLPFRNSSFCFDRQLVNSTSLLEQISATTFLGVSGLIAYDSNGADRVHCNHYVTRNAQPSSKGVRFVPVLNYSDAGEWHLFKSTHDILWPGKSYTVPKGQAAISSLKLRIGLIQSRPFTMARCVTDQYGENTSTIMGYIPDLIDLLQQKMKFASQLVLSPSNQNYSKLIQELASGDYDVLMGDVTVTSARRELVDFSLSIFDSSLRLIMRRSTTSPVDLLSYLRPFSFSLWMVILVTTICTSFLIIIVERRENAALRDRSIASIGAMSFWYSLGNIMGYGVEFHVTTLAGRLLTAALYISSLILVASYTANLASNLTMSKTKYIINGIEDIQQGKLPHSRVGVRVGTSIEDFYVREVSWGSRNYYALRSHQELYERLSSGDIDAGLMDAGTAEYMTNNVFCDLTLVGPSFEASTYGIVFPRNWPYVRDFDINVLALRESGQLDALRKKWFQTKSCDETVEIPNAMNVESMAGLFLTVGIIVLVALLTLVWNRRMSIKNSVRSFIRRRSHCERRIDPAPIALNQSSAKASVDRSQF